MFAESILLKRSHISRFPTITIYQGEAASGIGIVRKGLECWGILTSSTKSTRLLLKNCIASQCFKFGVGVPSRILALRVRASGRDLTRNKNTFDNPQRRQLKPTMTNRLVCLENSSEQAPLGEVHRSPQDRSEEPIRCMPPRAKSIDTARVSGMPSRRTSPQVRNKPTGIVEMTFSQVILVKPTDPQRIVTFRCQQPSKAH